MNVLRRPSATGLIALSLVFAASSAMAAPDHLVCRRAKETAPRTTYSADVISAAYAGTGCTITAPAKVFCEEATVSNVNPTPANPSAQGRGNPGRFLCYRLKCPRQVNTVTMTDRFGAHTTSVSAPKQLCVPEVAEMFSSCSGPGADCNSCLAGCAAHSDPNPPTNICVNPANCYSPEVACASDAGCIEGYACAIDPLNSPQTTCCPACAP